MRLFFAFFLFSVPVFGAAPKALITFFDQQCFECHDADVKKGGIDLTSLNFDLADPSLIEKWVKIHDSI